MTRSALILLALIVPPGCANLTASPVLDDWKKFEQDLARWYDKHYGHPTEMRFEALGFAYPIGSVLRKGTNSNLSSQCKFNDVVPQPYDGPQLPEVKSSWTIDAKVDLDYYARNLMREGSKLNTGIKFGSEMSANIRDPKVYVLAEDQTATILKDAKCLDSLIAQDVSVVRGYLEAKYSISSKVGYIASTQATIRANDIVKLTYDSSESFTIEDVKPSKKFVILADATVVKAVSESAATYGTCVPTLTLKSRGASATSDDRCQGVGLYHAAMPPDPNLPTNCKRVGGQLQCDT